MRTKLVHGDQVSTGYQSLSWLQNHAEGPRFLADSLVDRESI